MKDMGNQQERFHKYRCDNSSNSSDEYTSSSSPVRILKNLNSEKSKCLAAKLKSRTKTEKKFSTKNEILE